MDALDMIEEIRGFQILKGFRGKPRADIEKIADVLTKLSSLSMDLKETIKEIDINPLMVYAEGRGCEGGRCIGGFELGHEILRN